MDKIQTKWSEHIMTIRNSAKAIIMNNGKLLAIKMQGGGGVFYILPGGGQENGENLHQTLERECLEEIGAEVEVGPLIFIREYIGKNHEFAVRHAGVHAIDFMYLCKVDQEDFDNGKNPDQEQIGVEWLPINELLQYNLYPLALRTHLISYCKGEKTTVYLGDIN